MGWSRYQNEIKLKQSYQLGSANRIIPDIIVSSIEKDESFVVEVKKPSEDIDSESYKNQLFSYMRQLKLTHGFLIGNKIKIYYDGVHNSLKDPILLKSIEINEANVDGSLFIQFFQKETFSYSFLESNAKKIIKEQITIDQTKELSKRLLSSEYLDNIKRFITRDLKDNWDEKVIDSILTNLKLSISSENTVISQLPPPTDSLEIKISELVRNNLQLILSFCEESEKELINLKSKSYSKNTFNINYPFLKQVTRNSLKQDRYWKQIYTINNNYYVVTSEWFEPSIPLFTAYLSKYNN